MALATANVTEVVTDRVWHVDGGTLDGGAVGNIVLTDKGTLPAGDTLVLKPGDNTFHRDPEPFGQDLAQTTQVTIQATDTLAAPLQVSFKATASSANPRLVIEFTNDDGANGTPPMDIWITVH